MKTFSTILTLVGLFFCQQWQATHQCDKLIDLLLIIDSSGSIPVQDFEEGKRAFIDITSKLNVGVEQAHVGIINFSTDIEAFAHDGVYLADLPTLEQRIKSLQYWGQGTATGKALTMAKEYCDLFCRPLNVGVPRIFAVFTDGQSNQGVPVLPAAQELKDISQGTIFAVGMGNLAANGEAELATIASDPSTKLHISSYQDLMRITNIISTQLCNTPAFIYPGQQIDLKLKGNETRYFRMKTLQNIKKNAIFEIRVNNKIGQSVIYTSTTNKNPSNFGLKTLSKRNTGLKSLNVYVPATASDFYFSVNGVDPKLNDLDFVVHVRSLNF